MENLELWKSVEKTDLQFTKHVTQRGGYTAIDPQYQAKMATEKFGPYGACWGLKESEFDFSMMDATGMVLHKAVFFYVLDGKEASFPIHNAIKPMQGAGDNQRPDEDWPKKVETNTISKALSRLGFNADVFMGMFDDAEYKTQLATEQAIRKAEDKEKVITTKRGELTDYITKQLETMRSLESANAINGVAKAALRHLERQKSIPELSVVAERGIKAIAREQANTTPMEQAS